MKKITLMMALCLGLTTGYAQKVKAAEVPAAVKDAFAKKYPGAKAEWEKEDGNYEAEFDGKVEGSVLIAPDDPYWKRKRKFLQALYQKLLENM